MPGRDSSTQLRLQHHECFNSPVASRPSGGTRGASMKPQGEARRVLNAATSGSTSGSASDRRWQVGATGTPDGTPAVPHTLRPCPEGAHLGGNGALLSEGLRPAHAIGGRRDVGGCPHFLCMRGRRSGPLADCASSRADCRSSSVPLRRSWRRCPDSRQRMHTGDNCTSSDGAAGRLGGTKASCCARRAVTAAASEVSLLLESRCALAAFAFAKPCACCTAGHLFTTSYNSLETK